MRIQLAPLTLLAASCVLASCSGDAEDTPADEVSDGSAEASADAAHERSSDASSGADTGHLDASSDAPGNVSPDAFADATSETLLDARDATVEASRDAQDATADVSHDAQDATLDASRDAQDATLDASRDAQTGDALPDALAHIDAPADGPGASASDASLDMEVPALPEASSDGPTDALSDAGADVVIDTGPPPPPNVMFVTSTTYEGNLGGLDGADEKCRQRATAAGLPGTFVALLSTSTVSAKSRLGNARGWVRPDGKPFADTQADLFGLTAKTYFPPRVDELGATLPIYTPVASGSEYDGTPDPDGHHCVNWTSNSSEEGMAMGTAGYGSYGYLDSMWSQCGQPVHLYCFEISRTSRVDPPGRPPNTRTAFITQANFITTTGIDGADALCAGEAGTAGLGGTYKALLATTLSSPISRFDTAGQPWVRVDGVPLAATALSFASDDWIAPLNVQANGQQIDDRGVWTGSTRASLVGTSTCSDWSTPDASGTTGLRASAQSSAAVWFSELECDFAFGRVYCLQN